MAAGYVYIIYSSSWDRHYVGSAVQPDIRLLQHNEGQNTSTKGGGPWQLKYLEKLPDYAAAEKREREIKQKKSRRYLLWLIENQGK